MYYRETATPTPPAHHPRLVCAVQGRSELQRILVDVLRARSARFPWGPGAPSGPQGAFRGPGPLGLFSEALVPKNSGDSAVPSTNRWADNQTRDPLRQRVQVFHARRQEGSSFGCTATLDVRGFELSTRGASRVEFRLHRDAGRQRVRVFRPWGGARAPVAGAARGSQGPGGVNFAPRGCQTRVFHVQLWIAKRSRHMVG